MFDDIFTNLKTIITAIETRANDSIGEALKASGDLIQNGWRIFKDAFDNPTLRAIDPVAACKAMIADYEQRGGSIKVDFRAIFALIMRFLGMSKA